MLWNLFVLFVKIGFLSFGGGYAVIPIIQHESVARGWLNEPEFQRLIGIAGMSPGPVAVNGATLIGQHVAGPVGAAVATLGILLPSLLIIAAAGASLHLLNRNAWLQAALYGLRPVVAALIFIAAVRFVFPSGIGYGFDWRTLATLAIGAGSVVALLKYKRHPLLVIAAAGAAGIILF